MRTSPNRIFLPLGIFLVALLGSLVLTGYFKKKGPQEKEEDPHPFPEILSWEWKDRFNQKFQFKDSKESYNLVYFGSLYGNESYHEAFLKFHSLSKFKFRYPLETVFFSLDPRRDATSLVSDTLDLYNLQTRYLGGNQEQTEFLAKKFGVRWKKEFIINSPLEYTLDSSPWMYLTTPDFRIMGAYPIQIRVERLKMEIDSHMKRKKKGK